jgi:hypothetical protein
MKMPRPISITNVKRMVSSNGLSSELNMAFNDHSKVAAMAVPAMIDTTMTTIFLFSQVNCSASDSVVISSLPTRFLIDSYAALDPYRR